MNEFDDPFALWPHSRPSERATEDGRVIRLIGVPLMEDARLEIDARVPENYGDFTSGRYFYTLPPVVLQRLIDELESSNFDAEALETEQPLSDICGDHTTIVGIWNKRTVCYSILRTSDQSIPTDEYLRSLEFDSAAERQAYRKALTTFEQRDVAPLRRHVRGYAGWLMTNQQFLDEHDHLLAEHADAVRRWGTAVNNFVTSMSSAEPSIQCASPEECAEWTVYREASLKFLLRWRLNGLAGPYLPVPLQALMGGCLPAAMLSQLMDVGGVFFLPDTMFIPGRDQLRGLLDDALRATDTPEYLEEWVTMVRAGNKARNQLDRFGRFLEIQHYLRILSQRHADVFRGNIERIEYALAAVFGCSREAIHADLGKIRRRLGGDWLDREWVI